MDMKVAMFSDSYLPYRSGVVSSLEVFKEELESLGHDIFIFAPSYPAQRKAGEKGEIEKKEERVFRFLSIPAPTNKDFTLAIPFHPDLKKKIDSWQPDLIHVHSPFLLGSLGAKIAKRYNLPLVFTFHTLYEEYVHYFPFAKKIVKKYIRFLAKNFCNQCDLVVVPTREVEKYLLKIGVRTKLRVVPSGIKINNFSSADPKWLRKHYGIAEQEKILLFVGRLGQEKNIIFLLETFFVLSKSCPEAILVLVGGGPEEKALRSMVEKAGLQKKVFFAGTVSKEEVPNYYAGADLFVFASVTETQGLVIAEAKAAGLPVIAVEAYGVKEMVEHGVDGFLTGLDKKEFTARALTLLKNEKLKEEFSRRAKINARKFSSRNCAMLLLEGYEDVLKGRGEGG
jgi:glycosyltransferase involved in cell wall biosynthesis